MKKITNHWTVSYLESIDMKRLTHLFSIQPFVQIHKFYLRFPNRKVYHNFCDRKWCLCVCECVRDRVKNQRMWCNSGKVTSFILSQPERKEFILLLRTMLDLYIFLVKKSNTDNEIKRYKPKIFNIFEISTDNVSEYVSCVFVSISLCTETFYARNHHPKRPNQIT